MLRIYAMIAAIVLVLGGWAWDRHRQYEAGEKACETAVQVDNGNILLFLQRERDRYEAKASIEAVSHDKEITTVAEEKPVIIEKVKYYAQTSPVGPSTVVLSDDELRYYNSLIEAANSAGQAED